MELLTTVQYLSDYFLITKADISYKKDIDKYFDKFKTHPIISLTKGVISEGWFNGSSAPWYLYQFSFPDFKTIGKITNEENQIEEYEPRRDTLELIKKQLYDFYVKSNFHKFYEDHKTYYDIITAPVVKKLMEQDIISILERHYGETNFSYNIVLTPLLHDGGFGASVNSQKGREIYGIIGPKHDSKQIPDFNIDEILQYYVLHEFSHAFCNPIIHKYFPQLEKDSCLIRPIFDEQNKQGYGGDWETCLYEHLVRANEVVLCKIVLGQQEADKIYKKYYEDRKWIYLKGLVPIIETVYLTDRQTYKTQYDLIPKILDYFDEEKNKNCQ